MTPEQAINKLENKKPRTKKLPVKEPYVVQDILIEDDSSNNNIKLIIMIVSGLLFISVVVLYHLWEIDQVTKDTWATAYQSGIDYQKGLQ